MRGKKRPIALFRIVAAASTLLILAAGSAAAQEGGPAEAAPNGGSSPSIEFPHLPRLVVTPVPSYGTAPLTVGFFVSNANPQSGAFVSYRFTFGDGHVTTLPPTLFFHTYTKPGSYVVEVTGTTADGFNSTGFTGVVVRAPR
jgi:PKD repeat protein